MTVTEIIGASLALLCVILTIYQHRWCWWVAIISSIFYVEVFWEARLYLEAVLQFVFIGVAIAGLKTWAKSDDADLAVTTWPWGKHLLGLVLIGLVSFALGHLLKHFSDSDLPFLDAGVTTASIFATWLAVQKKLENWLYWIVIDMVATAIYISKGLHITAVLYVIYVVLAVHGYSAWRKTLN